MNLHYLQHVPFEGIASILQWASTRDYPISSTRFYHGDLLPDLDAIDLLVVMGGPMNIYEEDKYAWLKQEKRFIEQAIKNNKRVLGICLGAQLIADVLGSKIYSNQYKEIGWLPIQFTDAAQTSSYFSFLPREMTVFHWHGDTFDLPQGTKHLAMSEGCTNQAFTYGENVIALQFHPEATPTSVQDLIKHCADEIIVDKYIQDSSTILSCSDYFAANNLGMFGILDKLTNSIHP